LYKNFHLLKKIIRKKLWRTELSKRYGKKYRYGIHVADMKYLSENSPIEKMPAPKVAYMSMMQHIGAPAIPIVNVGDKVKKRQLIAKANGPISANIYSSICGTVTDIKDIVVDSGKTKDKQCMT
jgi:electron transport complex protein RnfC